MKIRSVSNHKTLVFVLAERLFAVWILLQNDKILLDCDVIL